MNETELLKSTVSEYRNLIETAKVKINGELDTERLLSVLIKEHDWTYRGAHAVTCLANEYGTFMLRNAFALAIVLAKEDGNLGF